MATDFYGNALIISERACARHLEAEAHRLANIVSKKGPIRHSVLKGTIGQALDRVIRVVLCKLYSIGVAERLSPCSESPAGHHRL
jgi:hypothetical protein